MQGIGSQDALLKGVCGDFSLSARIATFRSGEQLLPKEIGIGSRNLLVDSLITEFCEEPTLNNPENFVAGDGLALRINPGNELVQVTQQSLGTNGLADTRLKAIDHRSLRLSADGLRKCLDKKHCLATSSGLPTRKRHGLLDVDQNLIEEDKGRPVANDLSKNISARGRSGQVMLLYELVSSELRSKFPPECVRLHARCSHRGQRVKFFARQHSNLNVARVGNVLQLRAGPHRGRTVTSQVEKCDKTVSLAAAKGGAELQDVGASSP